MSNATLERLWRWSDEGRLPVVVEGSSCTHGIREARPVLTAANRERFDRLQILDSVEFVHDTLLPGLRAERRLGSACIHPVCSVVEMGLVPKLVGIGRFVAERGGGPGPGRVLRLRRGPRLSPSRADRLGDPGRGGGDLPSGSSTPT